MSNNNSIRVNNVSKVYKLYDSSFERLKESFHPFKKEYHRKFNALTDVSFEVQKGEILGIVGKNGSGKSTILQIITGVLTPTTGSVEVIGNVSALLELGAGFNPELSGRENVFFKSSLLGYSTAETQMKLGEIISFADIGQFIDQPVKTYSSGMYVRLAFAAAIIVDPDVLIIDEALSVGDYRFRLKCLRRIREFREKGKTILFVSHDTGSIIEFCTKAIWLLDGKIQAIDTPSKICKDYLMYMTQESVSPGEGGGGPEQSIQQVVCVGNFSKKPSIRWECTDQCSSFGEGGAAIKKTSLYLKNGTEMVKIFEGGKRVVFYMEIHVKSKIENPIVGFHLSDNKGVHILGMNTAVLGHDLGVFQSGDIKVVEFEFDFPFLKIGPYSFSPAIADGSHDENTQHHWIHDAYIVKVSSKDKSQNLGHYFAIKKDYDIRLS